MSVIQFFELEKKMKYLEKAGTRIFWNNWITFVKETYLMMALTACITFKYYFKFDKWGDSIQSTSAIVLSVFYILLPISVLIYCLIKFK